MALAGLKSNDQVFVHGVATTPTVLIDGFAAHVLAKNLTGIKTVHIHTEGKLAHLVRWRYAPCVMCLRVTLDLLRMPCSKPPTGPGI
jgi:hypothetical protein